MLDLELAGSVAGGTSVPSPAPLYSGFDWATSAVYVGQALSQYTE